MLKLFLRAVSNVIYACSQLAYDLDIFVSALTLGAEGESISSRLWVASQTPAANASKWVKLEYYVWKPFRVALDWFVYAVFGEANHTQTAYKRYLAIKAA